MSIDALQEKIRKRKCALIVDMTVFPEDLPGGPTVEALERFWKDLLRSLRGRVPGVRFRLSALALMGPEAMAMGKTLTREARNLGFYVLLDVPEADSPELAAFAARQITGEGSDWACDGIVLPMYAGFDVLQPWLEPCEKQGLDIFALCRTPNKSAAELQDLLCGTRLAYTAVADQAARFAGNYTGKFGYSRVGLTAAAGVPASIKNLRSKYPNLFLLVDGMETTGANFKNVSFAFDKLGRGAAYCAGPMVTLSWKQEAGTDIAAAAQKEVERKKAALQRYVTCL